MHEQLGSVDTSGEQNCMFTCLCGVFMFFPEMRRFYVNLLSFSYNLYVFTGV